MTTTDADRDGAPCGADGAGASDPGSLRLATFRAAVLAGSSGYVEVEDLAAVVAHVRAHGEVVAMAPSLLAREPALREQFEAEGVRVVVPDGADPAAEVADVPLAIVRGELGIAETGSVLVSEHALGDRVVTMLCRRLIQVVDLADVVDRLESAAAWLAERSARPGFASLMTGPSRTADIERSLTIGVQGPDEVDVLVLVPTAEQGAS